MHDNGKKKVVGGYVPTHLADRLSLYTTIHNIPRAGMIELIVTKILDDAPSTVEMIQTLARREADLYNESPFASEKGGWKKWKKERTNVLLRKKIPLAVVSQILTSTLAIITGTTEAT